MAKNRSNETHLSRITKQEVIDVMNEYFHVDTTYGDRTVVMIVPKHLRVITSAKVLGKKISLRTLMKNIKLRQQLRDDVFLMCDVNDIRQVKYVDGFLRKTLLTIVDVRAKLLTKVLSNTKV